MTYITQNKPSGAAIVFAVPAELFLTIYFTIIHFFTVLYNSLTKARLISAAHTFLPLEQLPTFAEQICSPVSPSEHTQ